MSALSVEALVRLAEQTFLDPEQAIVALEAGLAASCKLQAWPRAEDRRLIRGKLLLRIGHSYIDRREGERAENLEKALTACADALDAMPKENFPEPWARVQHNLAHVYWVRVRGDLADNLERAIAASEAALTVRTREAFPTDWAQSQNSLANAYRDRIRGERADNLERAIAHYEAALTVRTREAFPTDWAQTQNNLAIAYRNRIRGNQANNLEQAIALYEAALAVRTREAFPVDWATTQNNLALAYWDRIRGERADNLERAIAACEAALTIRTREASPEYWAQTQNNLALTYSNRIRGERADNLEQAIAHYEAALTVYTPQAFPYYWALAQSNSAIAYSDRIRGERADNLERAIAGYEAALTVYTREAFPTDWALTQSNLASAYRNRIRGERADNLERAIAACEAALTVYTRETFPTDWARSQHDLANAYSERIRGERAGNLEQAITAYEAALTVYTRETLPRDHLGTGQSLGQALLAQHAWHKTANALSEARETFLLLFGQGLDEAEARGLVEVAGSLFTNAAYVAVELGDPSKAFHLACEGRARLIATALRLQTLDLVPEQRRRLEGLQTEIREQSRVLKQATGLERADVLDRLKRLRAELSATIGTAEERSGESDALAQATPLIAGGGALAVPIVTEAGAKLLIVTRARDQDRPAITVIDLPQLTTWRLKTLLGGDDAAGTGGWLAAFGRGVPWRERKARTALAVEGIGAELWTLLGAPLERALSDLEIAPGARLILMPSGGLGLLPLGLAQEPSLRRRLFETYDIVTAPSLSALAKAARAIERSAAPSLAAVVNPTGDLIFAPIEGALVAAHFEPERRALLDERTASPDTVLAALKGKTHWHFSTHGTFDLAEPRRSALAMRDGASLSVGSLLEADDLGRPRLVVLSACDTGLHDIERTPEEFIGLPGTFMTIGARAVLGTLWAVDDYAAALLTARFYDLHLDEGLAPATALRKAQLWLRSATRGELSRYACTAEAQGRLSDRHTRQLQLAVAGAASDGVRFFDVAGPEIVAVSDANGCAPARGTDGSSSERPFTHPVYWGGWVVTGL